MPTDQEILAAQVAAMTAAIKKRLTYAQVSEADLDELIKKIQADLWKELERDILSRLDIKGGNIEVSTSNKLLMARFRRLQRKYAGDKTGLAKDLFTRLSKQVDLAAEYFEKTLIEFDGKVAAAARARMVEQLGFDGKTFAEQGFLVDMVNGSTEMQKIRAATFKAIVSGASWSNFYEGLKALVVGTPSRQGVTTAELKRITYDVFQQNDAAINKSVAEELGLAHYIYQGIRVRDSRAFCLARVGKVFTKEEVEAWSGMTWQGKSTPYNPFHDRGGYRCGHQLNPISRRIYEHLAGQN